MRKSITSETRKLIFEAYENGASYYSIGEMFGLKKHEISTIVTQMVHNKIEEAREYRMTVIDVKIDNKCLLCESISPGIESKVLSGEICPNCIKDMTIGEAKNLAGSNQFSFITEIYENKMSSVKK